MNNNKKSISYFSFLPSELLELIIPYFDITVGAPTKDLDSFILSFPEYKSILNWNSILFYNFKKNINKAIDYNFYRNSIIFNTIEKLKKVFRISLGKYTPEEIYNLDSIHLRDFNTTEIPPEIGVLANLKTLYLYGNKLTKIPKEIGNLSKLETLHLSSNQIKEMPVEVRNLVKLRILYLYMNKIDDNEKAKLKKLLPKTKIVY